MTKIIRKLIFVLFYQVMKIKLRFCALALPNRLGLAKLKKKAAKAAFLVNTGVVVFINIDLHSLHLNLRTQILTGLRMSLRLCATKHVGRNISY